MIIFAIIVFVMIWFISKGMVLAIYIMSALSFIIEHWIIIIIIVVVALGFWGMWLNWKDENKK